MARPSKPWYRSDRGEWFVTIRGVVHRLSSDRDEAFRKFHRLMSGVAADPVTDLVTGESRNEFATFALGDWRVLATSLKPSNISNSLAVNGRK
jgi:hypothetical protein